MHHESPSEISRGAFKRFLCSGLGQSTRIGRGYEKTTGSYHHCYRLNGQLIAMGVLDLLPSCVSSVYLMYILHVCLRYSATETSVDIIKISMNGILASFPRYERFPYLLKGVIASITWVSSKLANSLGGPLTSFHSRILYLFMFQDEIQSFVSTTACPRSV